MCKMYNNSAKFVAKGLNNTLCSVSISRHAHARGSYLHNPGSEPLTYSSLGEVIAETAHKQPGTLAVTSLHEGKSLTYEQLLNQADSLGCAFRAQGLQKGDRVGIWSHNNAGWLVTIVAAARAGLVSTLINPAYENRELGYCIKKAGLKSIYIGDRIPTKDYYKQISELIPEVRTSRPGSIASQEFPLLTSIITPEKERLDGTFTLDSLLADYKNTNDITKYSSEVTPEDGSIIHFTSGTTGNPKAVLDSHFGVVNNAYYTGKRNGFSEGQNKICVQVPLFHALGSIITSLGALRHGSSLVLAAPSYSPSATVKALHSQDCTILTGTPTMHVDVLTQLRREGTFPSGLRMVLSAGAPSSPQLIRDIQKYLKANNVLNLYGLTESTASIFQSVYGESIDLVAETVGYIQDHVEVKVIDEDGKMVPFGQPGELVSRGYNNMICYLGEPEKTRETLDEHGWLRTGDKFVISKDGYGRIVGRIKDIIVRGGENIAPKEIEDLINTHPDVVESQVIGVADERLGEELCAVLRVRDGATVTLDDVKRHLAGRLAKYKIPRILKLAEVFPKTASGKIQKFRLKEIVEAGKL